MSNSKQDTVKFPLGNNLFVTVNCFRNKPQVHLRHFVEIVPHDDKKKKSFVVPTKKGIVLNPNQAQQLNLIFPRVISELQKVMGAQTADYQPHASEMSSSGYFPSFTTPPAPPLQQHSSLASGTEINIQPNSTARLPPSSSSSTEQYPIFQRTDEMDSSIIPPSFQEFCESY